MKMKRIFSTLLSAILLAVLVSGCAGSTAKGGPITITDMTGREIKLEKHATRIVAITPSDCEILFALGAGDTVVGRGTYCDYPAEVLNVQEVESGQNLNVEQVMALKPDVVLMTTMAQTEEQVKALEDAGTRVIISDAQNIQGVYEAIALIGSIVGKDAEAKKLVDDMEKSFADIEKKVGDTPGETVYFEVSPLEYGLWTAGSNTFMDEIATMLGLVNAFAEVDGWGEISEEQVLDRDPDYIITITMYFGEGPTPVEEILSRPGWNTLKAVENGHVFNVDNNEIARPGPRLVNAAQALYDYIYAGAGQNKAA